MSVLKGKHSSRQKSSRQPLSSRTISHSLSRMPRGPGKVWLSERTAWRGPWMRSRDRVVYLIVCTTEDPKLLFMTTTKRTVPEHRIHHVLSFGWSPWLSTQPGSVFCTPSPSMQYGWVRKVTARSASWLPRHLYSPYAWRSQLSRWSVRPRKSRPKATTG